jgi:translation elongation factor EF-4
LAVKEKLKIIPVINKIDMMAANVEAVELSMIEQFNFDEKDIIKVSAKSGLNVKSLLNALIDKIPEPNYGTETLLKGFLIDSWFVKDKGVIMLF